MTADRRQSCVDDDVVYWSYFVDLLRKEKPSAEDE